jgi:hypothetical protein
MQTVLKYVFVLFAVYLAAWTVSYTAIMSSQGGALDSTYLVEYLRLAWTFNGGELPSLIWLSSIIAFLPLAGLAVSFVRRWDRRNAFRG